MTDRDQISAILAETGERDEAIGAILATEDGDWLVHYDDLEILVELDEDFDRLVFTAVIGPILHEDRANVLEALLATTAMWRTTRGVRMALSGPGGDVLQIFDLPCIKADASTLAMLLSNLAQNTRTWRGLLSAQVLSPSRETGAQTASDMMIRI